MVQTSSCGLKLLYGTERVCPDTLAALSELAKERGALAKMKEMQASIRPHPRPPWPRAFSPGCSGAPTRRQRRGRRRRTGRW